MLAGHIEWLDSGLTRAYLTSIAWRWRNHRFSKTCADGCWTGQGQEKMSKSDPNSAIFMEDSAAEVKTKIKKAFCPPEQVLQQLRPLLWYQHMSLPNTFHCRTKKMFCT